LIRYELQPGLGVSVMKLNLQARGIIDCAVVRPPTKAVDSIGLKEVEELRKELALA
jgi:4-hydroxy-tetrahydrodipicolinate synthase